MTGLHDEYTIVHRVIHFVMRFVTVAAIAPTYSTARRPINQLIVLIKQ